MQLQRAVLALVLAAAGALVGCGDATPTGGNTSVLGGSDGRQRHAGAAPLTDARGREIPQPHLPANTAAEVARAGDENAIAVWVQDGHVIAAAYAPTTGWSAPQPLEAIYGEASEPQLVANGSGAGMAVWRHTVGSIQSLRFSRFDPAKGWSEPDVMPGALPRPPGQASPPQLVMDDAGNVTAQWPSGFDPNERQTARYSAGGGWSRASSESLASAPDASPARPAPSSGR